MSGWTDIADKVSSHRKES